MMKPAERTEHMEAGHVNSRRPATSCEDKTVAQQRVSDVPQRVKSRPLPFGGWTILAWQGWGQTSHRMVHLAEVAREMKIERSGSEPWDQDQFERKTQETKKHRNNKVNQ